MATIPGGFYLNSSGEAINANGDRIMATIVWVKNTQLSETKIVDGVIYAPSDADDAKNLPKKVKLALGLIVATTEPDEPEQDVVESAPIGG